jgi:hypothetical protein
MEIQYPYVYKGWPNCVHLSNDIVELVATTDVGPRIIRFGFVGETNEFVEIEETLGQTGGDQWKNYGGHRLWFAPEDPVRTYYPDNSPIEFENHGNFVRLIQPVEATSGIKKEIDIFLSPDSHQVTVVHRLFNHTLWTVELAPWALSVMAPGGVAIAPLPPRAEHPDALLPVNSLSMWAYTDMSDPRWAWGKKHITLQQDPSCKLPQKVGLLSTDGWVAYANNDHLFVKTFNPELEYMHPDFNSNIELFTNNKILEVETIGALVELQPEGSIEYTEVWHLFKGIKQPENENDVVNFVLPAIESIT